MKNKDILFLITLFALIFAIRIFENQLFYDPFIAYFKTEYATLTYPDYNPFLLYLNLIFRYLLNGILTLAILYVLFKDVSILKFSGLLLFLFLILLIMISFFTLNYLGESQKNLFFYVRRFIIQPIFLLLFIPAFYYQKKKT